MRIYIAHLVREHLMRWSQ